MTARQRRRADAVFPAGAVLLDPVDDGHDWRERALCAQTDPDAFFPEKGGSTREAKKVCRACEVRTECLEYALANDERFGVWGGLSERQRRALKRPSESGGGEHELAPADKTCLRCNQQMPSSQFPKRNTTDTGICHDCETERRNHHVTVSQLAAARQRREGGETTKTIAADLGVSPSHLRRLLAGSRHPVPDRTLEEVA